jgi:hypothetical protein
VANTSTSAEDVDLLQVMMRAMNTRRVHIEKQEDEDIDDWDM